MRAVVAVVVVVVAGGGAAFWLFFENEPGDAPVVTARPPTPATAATAADPRPARPKVEVETARPEPAREVWPAEEVGAIDPARFDSLAFAERATGGARKRWRNVELVVLHAVEVGSDGLSDLTVTTMPASYGFRPKGAKPSDAKDEGCAYWVVVEASRVYSMAEPAPLCRLPAFAPAPPRCTPAGVFAKVAEKYRARPGERANSFTFKHDTVAGKRSWEEVVVANWSVSGFPTFGDAGGPTDLSTDAPDDCGEAPKGKATAKPKAK